MSSTQPSAPKRTGKALPSPKRTPAQKAAAILALLEPETLQKLTGRLSERHREKLLEAVRSLSMVDVQEQKRIAQEFALDVARGRNAVRGNEDIAERLKNALFHEPDTDEEMPGFEPQFEIDEDIEFGTSIWDEISNIPAVTLVKFFSGKSSAVLSIALYHLPDDLVSELVGELDEAAVKAAMIHLGTSGVPNPVAVSAVENLLREELLENDDPAAIADTGEGNPNADKIAGYLNRMISSRRDAVLDALDGELSEEDAALIRSKVLSFAGLEARLPRSAIPMVLREIDEKSMLTALKYGMIKDASVVDYLLANISQRMAGQYREKMEEMPDIDEETGEKAQSSFICMILGMADDGKIELKTEAEE